MEAPANRTTAEQQSPSAAPDETTRQKQPSTRLFGRRYLILAIFIMLSASNAFQWIEYSIIANVITQFYDVPPLAVDWTSIVYMSNYVPLVLPATWLLDRHGLRLSVLMGGFGNALGALIKCMSARPDRFWLSFIGQTIAGSSQVFILGVPPRLAAVWFGPREVSTACAVGVFGNQVGIALGFLMPPMLVPNSNETLAVSGGLQRLFFSSAAVNLIVFVLIYVLFSDTPPLPPSRAQLAAIEDSIEKNYYLSLKRLCTNVNYLLLLVTYGINVGAFYAVSTLLNPMVLKHYEGEELNTGRIGLLIVVSGMVGSVVCGLWLDKTHAFKCTTLTVYLFTFVGMLAFAHTIGYGLVVVFVIAAFLGFFMTGYLPIGFEFGAELTHPVSEGTVSGLLNASAQVFGVCMTSLMGLFVQKISVYACNISLSGMLLIGTVLTTLIKPDLRRQAAGRADKTLENRLPYQEELRTLTPESSNRTLETEQI